MLYLEGLVKQCEMKGGESEASIVEIQKHLAERIEERANDLTQALYFVFEGYFYPTDGNRKYSTVNSSQKNSKSGKTILMESVLAGDRDKNSEAMMKS